MPASASKHFCRAACLCCVSAIMAAGCDGSVAPTPTGTPATGTPATGKPSGGPMADMEAYKKTLRDAVPASHKALASELEDLQKQANRPKDAAPHVPLPGQLPFKTEGGKLVAIDLIYTPVTDDFLKKLAGLVALEDLTLTGTEVTDAGLEHLSGLTSLRRLGLSRTQVTDAGLAHLRGLNALQHLGLERTQVTAAGVSDLQQALPNLKIYR